MSRPPEAAPLPARDFAVAPARPAVAGRPAPLPQLPPQRLVVPSLGIDAPLQPESSEATGALVVPGDPARVGLWDGGAPLSASSGTTLLAGHVDSDGRLGALHGLHAVTPGARILTSDARGRVRAWGVTSLRTVPKEDLPAFEPGGPRRLAVVTCGGAVLDTPHGRTYADNVVVTAEPAG